MRRTIYLACWLGLVAALGCGNEKLCAPGATQQCACPGGIQGAQTCAADGAKWEACVCSGAASPASATVAATATAAATTPATTATAKGKAELGSPCRRSGDCAGGHCCVENGKGSCVPNRAGSCAGFEGCVSNADCGQGFACESVGAFGKCVARQCKTFADCTAGHFCFTDANGSRCVPRKGIGEKCVARSQTPVDCQEGLMCAGILSVTCQKLPK